MLACAVTYKPDAIDLNPEAVSGRITFDNVSLQYGAILDEKAEKSNGQVDAEVDDSICSWVAFGLPYRRLLRKLAWNR